MVAVVTAFSSVAEPESRSIARALRRRDSEFIGRMVSRYHYRLLRYLVYWTSRREQAEDLVQETWLRVLERAGQYDGRLRFEPWLFSIARNLAIDHLRKQQTAAARHRVCGEDEAGLNLPAPDFESPFFAAARSEDAKRIAAALGALEPIYPVPCCKNPHLPSSAALPLSSVHTLISAIRASLIEIRRLPPHTG